MINNKFSDLILHHKTVKSLIKGRHPQDKTFIDEVRNTFNCKREYVELFVTNYSKYLTSVTVTNDILNDAKEITYKTYMSKFKDHLKMLTEKGKPVTKVNKVMTTKFLDENIDTITKLYNEKGIPYIINSYGWNMESYEFSTKINIYLKKKSKKEMSVINHIPKSLTLEDVYNIGQSVPVKAKQLTIYNLTNEVKPYSTDYSAVVTTSVKRSNDKLTEICTNNKSFIDKSHELVNSFDSEMSNMNPKMEDIDTKISNLMDSFAQICDTLISSIKHLESIKHDNSAIHNKLKELSGVVSDIKSIKATI